MQAINSLFMTLLPLSTVLLPLAKGIFTLERAPRLLNSLKHLARANAFFNHEMYLEALAKPPLKHLLLAGLFNEAHIRSQSSHDSSSLQPLLSRREHYDLADCLHGLEAALTSMELRMELLGSNTLTNTPPIQELFLYLQGMSSLSTMLCGTIGRMNELIPEIEAQNNWEKQLINFGLTGAGGLALGGGLVVGLVVSNPVGWALAAVMAVAGAVFGYDQLRRGLQRREKMEIVNEGACPNI